MSSTGNSDTAAVAKPPLPQDINCKDSTLDVEYWAFRWQHEYTGWHEKSGNKLMWDFIKDTYLKSCKKNRADMKVFVPMCAKAEDMWMLHELDYTVVGVEIVDHYIEDFFKEHNLKPKVGKI